MAPSRRLLAISCLGLLLACATQQAGVPAAPTSPEATVGQFLAAVNANDLERMGTLFGDERGSSTARWNATERQQRMAIMQRLLQADSAHVVGSEPVPGSDRRRLLRVELFRGERRIPAPFTLAMARSGGWLVAIIGLDALLPGATPRPNL